MDKTKRKLLHYDATTKCNWKITHGSCIDGTIQDILIRFKRMQGYNTLWLPGSDHASISTEMKVVQKIKRRRRKNETRFRKRKNS